MYFLWLDLLVEHSKATEESALQKHRALENSARNAKTAHRTLVLLTPRHAWISKSGTRRVFATFDILRQLYSSESSLTYKNVRRI